MDQPSLVKTIRKVATAGEKVGFSLDQMIEMLEAGMTIEALLCLIAWRLEEDGNLPRAQLSSSRWLM